MTSTTTLQVAQRPRPYKIATSSRWTRAALAVQRPAIKTMAGLRVRAPHAWIHRSTCVQREPGGPNSIALRPRFQSANSNS
jgi:hypothetical protein